MACIDLSEPVPVAGCTVARPVLALMFWFSSENADACAAATAFSWGVSAFLQALALRLHWATRALAS